jgi:ketosteroid isomerase-like protein
MQNEDVVKNFFLAYQAHDCKGMHSCLDENVKFSDFGFDIQGDEVRAMWHLFTSQTETRPPIEVPGFEIIKSNDDLITAKYQVKYPFGEKKRVVDYTIEAHMKLKDGKIIDHKDISSITEWAWMAFGLPVYLISWTPYFHNKVKKDANERLQHFMREHNYLSTGGA